MSAKGQKRSQLDELRLAAQIHDISAAQAIAIGLLKGWNESMGSDWAAERRQSIEVFEHVLGDLRQLLRSVSEGDVDRHRPASVIESLAKEAKSVGVDLDLRLAGQEDWLTDRHAELVRLVGREAIRNVKRHSGSSVCRITIDLSICPFVMTVRDWGAGSQPDARPRHGLALLESLAKDLGGSMEFRSQPGLGVALTLTGPRCGLARAFAQASSVDEPLRSVVAEESVGSRKRVAARRPVSPTQQQITKV
jgi:signal transduction histidine kinase